MSSASAPAAINKESFSFILPPGLAGAVKKAHQAWDSDGKTHRLWQKDTSLWTNTDESKWLGWLEIVDQQLSAVAKFKALGAEIREDGFNHVVLLGMDGSSLTAEVFSLIYGHQLGFPELLVLDSTDPVQIKSLRDKVDPARTLFCVSSKSGTTLEPAIYMQYFFDETKKEVGDRAGHYFIAVTDPGSKLEGVAAALGFRRVYHGVPSIGGRYSVFSDFGLVPHAAAGLDTENFLNQTSAMVEARKSTDSVINPGVSLGLVLGTAAKFGPDKVTLICSQSVDALGAWLEQWLAESTGKEGRGFIPIHREPLFSPEGQDTEVYNNDRVFAYIRFADDDDKKVGGIVSALEQAGQPVVRIVLNDLNNLGEVFFQWEMVAAVAGSVMGVNAFNQPDLEASKVATRELTTGFEKIGSLPAERAHPASRRI